MPPFRCSHRECEDQGVKRLVHDVDAALVLAAGGVQGQLGLLRLQVGEHQAVPGHGTGGQLLRWQERGGHSATVGLRSRDVACAHVAVHVLENGLGIDVVADLGRLEESAVEFKTPGVSLVDGSGSLLMAGNEVLLLEGGGLGIRNVPVIRRICTSVTDRSGLCHPTRGNHAGRRLCAGEPLRQGGSTQIILLLSRFRRNSHPYLQ